MSLQENDFIFGLTGTTIVDGGTIEVPIRTAPLILEGNKTFRIRLRKDNENGETISISPVFTMFDYTSLDSITANVNVLDEGQSVEITVLTSNIPNGTSLYYSIGGYSGNLDQLDVTPFSGNVIINDNTGIILISSIVDVSAYIDDNESFIVQLRTESTTGTLVGNSEVISIVDTSNSARFSALTLNRDSALAEGTLYESESFVIELDTVNGEGLNSGNLYYSIVGNANIIGSTTGRIPINNNFGNSDTLIFETSILEGETRDSTVRIHVNSTNGAIVGSSSLTTLNYVSGLVYPKVSTITEVYPNVTSVLGADSIGFTVNGVNTYDGEVLRYKTTGNAAVQTGSFTITANTGTIILNADDDTEVKVLGLDVYRFTDYNGILNSSNVVIDITPKDEILVALIPPSNDNIVEGEGYLIQFSTTFGVQGSKIFYWDVTGTGTLQQSEGQSNSLTNLLVIPETIISSGETKEFSIRVREGSNTGTLLYTSNLLTVVNYDGQEGLNLVTPVVTSITPNTSVSYGSVNFTISTVGGNTLGNLYYSTNVFDGSSITFSSANTGYVNVNSPSANLVLNSSGIGEFTIQLRRDEGTPLLFESNSVLCFVKGSGGTIIENGTLISHIFTGPGTFTSSIELSNVTLFLSGGGGGGNSSIPRVSTPQGIWSWGGGGGGGGVVQYYGPLTSGSYPVGIGGGGAGAPNSTTTAAGAGGNTTGFGLTAVGGGRGGTSGSPSPNKTSTTGGSGGGGQAAVSSPTWSRFAPSSPATQPTQPGDSGLFGGGGNGSGGDAGNYNGGAGGSAPVPISSIRVPPSYGVASPLGPTYRRFGVGGGAGPWNPGNGATAGSNSGGGGTGGGSNIPNNGPPGVFAGGSGGSGIVIVQYDVIENI